MFHQIEFLIEGNLLPMTMGELRVSENLFIEAVLPRNFETGKRICAIAYVAAQEEKKFFITARDYLDFFILIYCVFSGQAVTRKVGIATTLDDLKSLGKSRVSFQGFEKLHFDTETKDHILSMSILKAKDCFLQLSPNRKKIMENNLGLALIFCYYGVLASQRRLEEAIINLMIASEALLITKSEKIRSSLSRRLSTLIAKNEEEKKIIAEKMRELYDLRSAIVHGGRKKPNFNDVRTLFSYVQRAIVRVLSSRDFSKENLVENLDKNEC